MSYCTSWLDRLVHNDFFFKWYGLVKGEDFEWQHLTYKLMGTIKKVHFKLKFVVRLITFSEKVLPKYTTADISIFCGM